MGDPRFPHKHYDTPSHPWQKERIEKENALVHQYGLRNKREIWRANTRVREMRHQARSLTANAASVQAQKERELLLARLNRLGMLEQGADLDDVLRMSVEKLLDRRLQTLVYLQG
ncbi:MAG: 30S ribosomal protein S4, partial [Candidatus Thermoplasmatota archaeon]|nr:30S ribosomal protein S4 [Candidatus Thermoplasmatota archaeon]